MKGIPILTASRRRTSARTAAIPTSKPMPATSRPGAPRSVHVAAIYEWLAVPAILAGGLLEYVARRLLFGRRSSLA
ncbi:hypothetical protein BRD00_11480 [Halobacteriales archaeon QS_8_69_26]|nr:MAG: hypothetical protein BRD00_11480 [Halobacteriales archaeon QS_8_69_26]